MADELGALEKEMAPHAQKLARIEALRKALRAACPAPAAQPWTVQGEGFIATLGPCANERVISLKCLIKRIGAVAFSRFATCTLTDLTEHVAPEIVAAAVSTQATGSRSLKTFERGTAA